jgi:hypothetical protein
MSELTRAIALQEAVKVGGNNILGLATTFNDFLTRDSQAESLPVKAAATAEISKAAEDTFKPKRGRPPAKSEDEVIAEAAAKQAAADAAADKAEEEKAASGPTKEEIGKLVEALLKANKRKEAVGLLQQFKAKSVSALRPEDYAAFAEGAEALLMVD